MQTYNKPRDGVDRFIDNTEMIIFTVLFQVITVFQNAFMFVAAFQASELISSVIKEEISRKEIIWKVVVILSLIPITLVVGLSKHFLKQSNQKQARRAEILTSIGFESEEHSSEKLHLFN